MQSLTLLICYMVNTWYQNRICNKLIKVLPSLSTRDVLKAEENIYFVGILQSLSFTVLFSVQQFPLHCVDQCECQHSTKIRLYLFIIFLIIIIVLILGCPLQFECTPNTRTLNFIRGSQPIRYGVNSRLYGSVDEHCGCSTHLRRRWLCIGDGGNTNTTLLERWRRGNECLSNR